MQLLIEIGNGKICDEIFYDLRKMLLNAEKGEVIDRCIGKLEEGDSKSARKIGFGLIEDGSIKDLKELSFTQESLLSLKDW